MVGNVIKVDNAMRQKTRLRFARVLVEMNTNDDFLDEIHVTNVRDELVTQQVVYEWKPILCNKCKKMGHNEQECRSGEGPLKAPKNDTRPRKDKEGFQKLVRKQYVVKQKPATKEKEGVTISSNPRISKSPPRVRSPRETQHHGVITPNPFDVLVPKSEDIIGEESLFQKLPIKALGGLPHR